VQERNYKPSSGVFCTHREKIVFVVEGCVLHVFVAS